MLTTDVFDTDTIVSVSRNFLVLPQSCEIMRTVVFIAKQRRYPVQLLPMTIIKASIMLLIVRLAIKAVMNFKIRKKQKTTTTTLT